MKKIGIVLIAAIMVLGGLGISALCITPACAKNNASMESYPDVSAYQYDSALKHDQQATIGNEPVATQGNPLDYPIGSVIWQYQITGGSDTSPKSMISIPDINGDGIGDVIVASEDDYVRCFSGGAVGTGQVLWAADIYAGSVYEQEGLSLINDVNGDGIPDVVVAAAWGARLIRCLSGSDGQTIWTHDTHEYGGGGWVYQVDARFDFNGDGVSDVLACTGDDGGGTGPNRVYCLNGLSGISIWERPLGGPGFSVKGVDDFTGDGVADVIAGCSNAGETIGYAKGINGASGALVWTFTAAGSSVWALSQIDDVDGDGIRDVVIGDFMGHVYGLNAATGAQLYMRTIGSVIITHFVALTDVNGDNHPDILIGHSSTTTVQVLNGQTGEFIWTRSVADQPWNVARIADISGDAIDDAVVGTLYNSNYCYFLNGVDGSDLASPISYGQAVDAITTIPDVVGDYSMEMLVGGRNGKVTCYSGGLNASQNPEKVTANFTATPTSGYAPLVVRFTDTSVAENTTITSWQWDFNHDGVIDSVEQNPVFTYTAAGNYTVSLRVSDGVISDTEVKEKYITVQEPVIAVSIGNFTGGLLKVAVKVMNTGGVNLTNVPWNITVGGGFVLLGKAQSGTFDSLPVGGTGDVLDRPVFGLGKITITVTVELPGGQVVTKTVTGTLMLFFIIIHG